MSKFEMTVYAAVWSKGAGKNFEGELDYQPLVHPIQYYDVKEKELIWSSSVAVFASKEEADNWLDFFDPNSKSLEIREVSLIVK